MALSLAALHAHTRTKGVNPLVYRFFRTLFEPFFLVWLRLRRIGRDHLPADGPAILAANHRSFLDPFVIGVLARRPVYYVAKTEIFFDPVLSWLLNRLGAFPVARGTADPEMLATARAILARGEMIVMFPEGTRTRRGPLRRPRRGIGRLALETGAPVVPVAVHNTEAVRRGWRIRPRRVAVRAGRPLRFPQVEHPTPQLAQAATDRVWACVELQYAALGGERAPLPAHDLRDARSRAAEPAATGGAPADG